MRRYLFPLLLLLPVFAHAQPGLPSPEVQARYPDFAPYFAAEKLLVEGGTQRFLGSDEASTKLSEAFYHEMVAVRAKLGDEIGLPSEVLAEPMTVYVRKARGTYVFIVQIMDYRRYGKRQAEFIKLAVRKANALAFKDGGVAGQLVLGVRTIGHDNEVMKTRVAEKDDDAVSKIYYAFSHGGETFLAAQFADRFDLGLTGRSDEEIAKEIPGAWRHECASTNIFGWFLPDGQLRIVYVKNGEFQSRMEGTWKIKDGKLVEEFDAARSTRKGDNYGPENASSLSLLWLEAGPRGKFVSRSTKDWQTWVPLYRGAPGYEAYQTLTAGDQAPYVEALSY
jgi:hypothetical protein